MYQVSEREGGVVCVHVYYNVHVLQPSHMDMYRILVLSGRTKRGYVLHVNRSGNCYFVVSNVRD